MNAKHWCEARWHRVKTEFLAQPHEYAAIFFLWLIAIAAAVWGSPT